MLTRINCDKMYVGEDGDGDGLYHAVCFGIAKCTSINCDKMSIGGDGDGDGDGDGLKDDAMHFASGSPSAMYASRQDIRLIPLTPQIELGHGHAHGHGHRWSKNTS